MVALLWLIILDIVRGELCSTASSLSSIESDGFEYSICGLQEYPQCAGSSATRNESVFDNTYQHFLCNALDFYAYTDTDINLCGCKEPHTLSDVVVLIDGTNYTDDYSWYFLSTSWLKLWFYDLSRYQPLINLTVLYYGSNGVEYIKSGDPVRFFGANWTIPAVFKHDTTPNLCGALSQAVEILDSRQSGKETEKILILLANTTPYLPSSNNLCRDIDVTQNISLDDIHVYAVKTSPYVNLSVVEDEYGAFDACMNIFDAEEYTPNWATYLDETSSSFEPNLDVYNYLNLMVSSVSDFVCGKSEICTYVQYWQSPDNEPCTFSCVEHDDSCVHRNASDYYMVNTYIGSQSLPLTQSEANDICLQYFDSHLATINSRMDQQRILALMESANSSNCWIGRNNIRPVFEMDGTKYFEWMDQTINALDFIENYPSNLDTGCVSVAHSGEWIVNDCDVVTLNCFLCNSVDSPMLTVSNIKYHVINSMELKSRDDANEYCLAHYSTHLSTIQSVQDQQHMLDALQSMNSAVEQNISSIVPYQSDGADLNYSAWIGDMIYISYDDCVDYDDGRTFTEIWADGSKYNFSLLDYQQIMHETCSPTPSPTNNPSTSPTTAAPTIPSVAVGNISTTANEIQYEVPISPTFEPTETPTLSPTIQIERYCSISREDASWQARSADDHIHSFSCNVLDRAQYAVENDDYLVFHQLSSSRNGKTWIEADLYCESIFGTKLATIYQAADEDEIIALRDTLKKRHNQTTMQSTEEEFDMWIGMKLDDGQFAQSHIEWTDGSRSNYSRLNSGCLVILQDAPLTAVQEEADNSWIIDSCRDSHHTWSCNNFVPTPYPTRSPTLSPTENIVQVSYFQRAMEIIAARPFETFYIILLAISGILTVFAFFHSKAIFCCCCCCRDAISYADDAKWSAVLFYALNIWDFLSDCSFAYNIEDRMSILFILSSSFILVPWICNICFLFIFRYQYSINNNFETNNWFRQHSYKLVLITMLCGSATSAINLMNSQIFGLSLFNMGLTKLQLLETSKFKVILNTALENIPQIVFTLYYMIITNGITDFAVMSLLSSTCSVILIIVVTIFVSIDPLNDEYLELTLKYHEPLERTGTMYDKLEHDLLKRFGFHKRIAQSLAFSFSKPNNSVFVDRHKYNTKTQSITLLVSVNCNKNTQNNAEQRRDEEETLETAINAENINIINRFNSKDATIMVIKLLESIKCQQYLPLFYQVVLVPLNKNGNKKLPISKKLKLDHHLITDLTMFDSNNENEMQPSSSLLRGASGGMSVSNPIGIEDNDQDEIMNIQGLPPRPLSHYPADMDNQGLPPRPLSHFAGADEKDAQPDQQQIEMAQKSPLNQQFSSSTAL